MTLPRGGPLDFESALDRLQELDCQPIMSGPDRARFRCPTHDDHKPSATLDRVDDDRLIVAYCHVCCPSSTWFPRLIKFLRDGLEPDYQPDPARVARVKARQTKFVPTAEYVYDTFPADRFAQHRKQRGQEIDPGTGEIVAEKTFRWRPQLDGQVPMLYRHGAIEQAIAGDGLVVVVEGEKDCDRVTEKLGLKAVSPAHGAGKWLPQWTEQLAAVPNVMIIADDDEEGRAHAVRVAAALTTASRSVEVWLPAVGSDISDHLYAGRAWKEIRQMQDDEATEAVSESAPERLVQPPGAPYPNAQMFLGERYPAEERDYRLLCHGSTFYQWVGPYWSEVEEGALRGEIYEYFSQACYLDPKSLKAKDFHPTRHKVADLLDAIEAITYLPRSLVPPAWLDPTAEVHAADYVSCSNGILHVPSRRLDPHTPLLCVQHAVPFAYDPKAPPPKRWLDFLDQLWPGDPVAIRALQEMFGYVLSGDTRLQKMFMLVGPKRSGKGTIARILKALIGADHVAGPTLNSLATNFGLQPLISKTLAIISDARISEGQSIVIEWLLSISGEDMLTVDRKYRDPWTGTLPTRLLVLTNELPRLSDSSGALASRFIILVTRESFYGRENPSLTDELLTELPGIFNWALDGISSIAETGHLTQPSSSDDAIREMEDLSSPVGAFVRDTCVLGADHRVRCEVLYQRWRQWCIDHGRDRPGTAQTFGRDLRAAVVGLSVVQPRDKDGVSRIRMYQGLDLQPTNSADGRVPPRASTVDEPQERDGTRSHPLSVHRNRTWPDLPPPPAPVGRLSWPTHCRICREPLLLHGPGRDQCEGCRLAEKHPEKHPHIDQEEGTVRP